MINTEQLVDLYFEDGNLKRTLIVGACNSEMVEKCTVAFLKGRKTDFYYLRSWLNDNGEWVTDFGSHYEFIVAVPVAAIIPEGGKRAAANLIEDNIDTEFSIDEFFEKHCKCCGSQRCDGSKEIMQGCEHYRTIFF